jgi:hypothetical protein
MGDFDFQLIERKERLDLEHQRQKILSALSEVEKELREEVSKSMAKAKKRINRLFLELQKEEFPLPTSWEYSFRLMMKTLQRNPRVDIWTLSFAREYWSDLMYNLPTSHRLLTDNIGYLKRVECNSETSGKLCSFCKQREFIISMEIWIPDGCVLLVCENCNEFANGVLDLWETLFTCVEEFKEDDRALVLNHYEKIHDQYMKIKSSPVF